MAKWSAPSSWAQITIAFDGLATAGSATGTTVITNGTGLDIFMDLSLRMGSINPTTAPAIEFHLIPLMDDGSTYQDLVKPEAVMPTTTGSSAKNVMARTIVVPPGSFKVALVNQTGVTTSGTAAGTTSNLLYYRTYSPA